MADDSKNMDGFMDGILMVRERREYEASLKEYWDYTSTLDTAEQKGSDKRAKKIAKKLKTMGMLNEQIAEATDNLTGRSGPTT